MSIHELIAIHILYLTDDIRHPLKLLLSTCHPQKVHLNMHGEVDQDFGLILLLYMNNYEPHLPEYNNKQNSIY